MSRSQEPSHSLLWKVIFLISLAVFLFSAFQLGIIVKHYLDARHEYADVAVQVAPEPQEESADPLDRTIDFASLQAINPEAVAWLWVPNVGIDYPVMHASDNDKYLRHTINGTYLSAGSIFEDYRNAADFSDRSAYIFGHHMKDVSMFSHLMDYRDQSVWQRDPYIYLFLPQSTRVYQIFSVHMTDANSDDYSFGFAGDEDYAAWLNQVNGKGVYATGVTVSPQDKVLTLSTCSSYWIQNSERFVVHAKLIKEVPIAASQQ